LHRTTA
ncbi:hypothetical protein D047_3621B, partial [Vibrio parahaemolyticus VPTS-2010_2]